MILVASSNKHKIDCVRKVWPDCNVIGTTNLTSMNKLVGGFEGPKWDSRFDINQIEITANLRAHYLKEQFLTDASLEALVVIESGLYADFEYCARDISEITLCQMYIKCTEQTSGYHGEHCIKETVYSDKFTIDKEDIRDIYRKTKQTFDSNVDISFGQIVENITGEPVPNKDVPFMLTNGKVSRYSLITDALYHLKVKLFTSRFQVNTNAQKICLP